MKNRKLYTIFLLFLVTACSVPKMRRSPYLQNVDLKPLHKHEYSKNFAIYSEPTGDWSKYKKFMLSPTLVSINPTLEYQHLNPTALKLTSDILVEEVQNHLREEFTETTSASQNVINIKLALTNMMAPSRDKEIGSMQIGLIPIGLSGAIFEAYFEDALSGELLAVVRDERIGLSSTTKFYKGFASSNYFHHAFGLWGTELCNILLEKTGRKRKEETTIHELSTSDEAVQSQEKFSTELEQVVSSTPDESNNVIVNTPHQEPTKQKEIKVIETPTVQKEDENATTTKQESIKEETSEDKSLGDDSFKF